jgi:5-(carboxyamino)imidazole ribonucleotide mutase
MIASLTILPVIGIPIKTKAMDGLDSLLSIVQMPPGIPVATVAVNGAKNAGLLAVSVLAINNEDLQKKLEKYKKEMQDEVLKKALQLEKEGFEKYLKEKE